MMVQGTSTFEYEGEESTTEVRNGFLLYSPFSLALLFGWQRVSSLCHNEGLAPLCSQGLSQGGMSEVGL